MIDKILVVVLTISLGLLSWQYFHLDNKYQAKFKKQKIQLKQECNTKLFELKYLQIFKGKYYAPIDFNDTNDTVSFSIN